MSEEEKNKSESTMTKILSNNDANRKQKTECIELYGGKRFHLRGISYESVCMNNCNVRLLHTAFVIDAIN